MKSTFTKALVVALIISLVGGPIVAGGKAQNPEVQAMARAYQRSMTADIEGARMGALKQAADAAVMQALNQSLMPRETYFSRAKDAVVNAGSAVKNRAGKAQFAIAHSLGLAAKAGEISRLKEYAQAGLDFDSESLTTAERIAFAREYAPVSTWQAAKTYASVAATTVAKKAALLAAFVKANPAQALKYTAETAGWAALAYGAYKGAQALYAWATAKPALKKVAPVIAAKANVLRFNKSAPKAKAKTAKKAVSKKAPAKKVVKASARRVQPARNAKNNAKKAIKSTRYSR